MAIQAVQQRRRRSGPKVKTGCGTCKIRKIKCDEMKPICVRCSSTGRKCDGYRSEITISSQSPWNVTDFVQRVSVHVPGNTEEKRGFHFFLRQTAKELSGYYDSSFWETLILAAATQKPSLRHAVIAIGALHEDFSRDLRMSPTTSAEEEKNSFALNQYSKAMGVLRKSLSAREEEPLTALMSCILFICFDSLRGCFESAMIHLQSGLKILRDMKNSSKKNYIIDDKIVPLFTRLSIQSNVYISTKSMDDQMEFAKSSIRIYGTENVIPQQFKNLDEARSALNQAANGLFNVFYMWDTNLPLIFQPAESLTLFDIYKSQLFTWNLAFENFMETKSKDFSNREVRGAALLKIHHCTAKIMAGVRPDISDLRAVSEATNAERSLEYVDDFRIIINLSRSLIAAVEEDVNKGKPPLTFSSDLGLIGPLYYVCVNCPTESLRTTAMDLLLRCPRREGMWDSVMVARMIQQFWDLEAMHYKEVHEMAAKIGEPICAVPFTDDSSVHLAYFGRLEKTDTTTTASEISLSIGTPYESTRSSSTFSETTCPELHGGIPS